MTELIVEVDATPFYDWAEKSVENVKMMVNTLKEIRVIYHNFIAPLTPINLGYLEHSIFQHSKINSDYPFFELELKMTGIDNPTAKGWDYALYMHEGKEDGSSFNYSVRGQLHYLETGFEEAEPMVMMRIETDYLSAIGGK